LVRRQRLIQEKATLDDPNLAPYRPAIDRTLDAHGPHPVMVVDSVGEAHDGLSRADHPTQ
jgi:hypothetical protein